MTSAVGDTPWTYAFGGGRVDGRGELKQLLGGKGAGLAEMSLLDIPVPPGFTLTTGVCAWFQRHEGSFPEGLREEVDSQLERLASCMGARFGDAEHPLLVSVRSGAPVSMPGMMDTVLNLGLSEEILRAHEGHDDERFLWDCYRRFGLMYGDVVLDVATSELNAPLRRALSTEGVEHEQQLSLEGLQGVVAEQAELFREHGCTLPQRPEDQLWGAIGAVFESWENPRAVHYRRFHEIPDDLGTAVNVQSMVFGNRGDDCATGVAFSRDPSTGERRLYGEYLVNAQGEDVVAGTHDPRPITPAEGGGLAEDFPQAHAELVEVCERLERHFRNMQDLEFTIERGKLYMLQTRVGKRSGPAALRIAVDMVGERLIHRREALRRVLPHHLLQVLAPVFDPDELERAVEEDRVLCHGLAAGPGAAAGRIAFTAERAEEMARQGPVLLVRDETSPEDIVGMHAAAGILTTRGGMTSHAAVVARGMGKPCVVGASALAVDEVAGLLRAGDRELREGEHLSIDGTRGDVLVGAIEARPSAVMTSVLGGERVADPLLDAFEAVMRWSDEERRLSVRANADTPADARVARTLGAQGIGLCRTEHMFFDEERIAWVRSMILAATDAERNRALEALLPVQQADFEGIFRALAGLPVTIRLLDPPLHEFLPGDERTQRELAQTMGVSPAEIAQKVEALRESNPMLGHRGCRLGVTFPEIYRMQTAAIARAACAVAADGVGVRPEIMIPLTGVEAEMKLLRHEVQKVLDTVFNELGCSVEVAIGTMIEVPRAALVAGSIARHSDFFSFGTNDLTQMTFGYSRDDAGRFLPDYLDRDLLPFDPFERLDTEGVGELVKIACERGRMARPDLKLGVCGEHGGDPMSIEFFDRCGLDYVSCSPYRLPIARLAAARSHLAYGPGRTPEESSAAAALSEEGP